MASHTDLSFGDDDQLLTLVSLGNLKLQAHRQSQHAGHSVGRRLQISIDAEEFSRRSLCGLTRDPTFLAGLPQTGSAAFPTSFGGEEVADLAMYGEELHHTWFFGEFIVRRYLRSAR